MWLEWSPAKRQFQGTLVKSIAHSAPFAPLSFRFIGPVIELFQPYELAVHRLNYTACYRLANLLI